MAEREPGFLGRWSRRKIDVSQGKPLDEPVVVVKPMPPVALATAATVPAPAPGMPPPEGEAGAGQAAEPPAILSLDDVRRLTHDSDFKPFMARDVGPEVRNAAMKKLFADPHYNVMDGLDTYIDDYTKSDPIPESMLRQMVGGKLLKLFDHEAEAKGDETAAGREPAPLPLDNPNNPTAQTVAQSNDCPSPDGSLAPQPEPLSQAEPPDGSGASQSDHAHSHLRLQQDHAPSVPEAGRGAS